MVFFLTEVACLKPQPDSHSFKYSPPNIRQGLFFPKIQEKITSEAFPDQPFGRSHQPLPLSNHISLLLSPLTYRHLICSCLFNSLCIVSTSTRILSVLVHHSFCLGHKHAISNTCGLIRNRKRKLRSRNKIWGSGAADKSPSGETHKPHLKSLRTQGIRVYMNGWKRKLDLDRKTLEGAS